MMRTEPQIARASALHRLQALAPLDAEATRALELSLTRPIQARARRDIVTEGTPIAGPQLIASGWAARVRLLADGRRQLLSFLLPGDLIGHCYQPHPVSVSTVTALTPVELCAAPPADANPSLARAYAISHALEQAYLLEHVARLGRLNAQERIYSLLLELDERLTLSGLAVGGSFDMPLTQETLADALGLTPVHVNRMVQQARRSDELDWRGGRVHLRNPARLARALGRQPTRVSQAPIVRGPQLVA